MHKENHHTLFGDTQVLRRLLYCQEIGNNAVLLLGHIGAALKHQFINKDNTLMKMLWK